MKIKTSHPHRTSIRAILCAVLFLLTSFAAAGCGSSEKTPDKVRDLDFTVVGKNDIPQELQEIIAQRQKEDFRLTYVSGQDLYIAAGYGEQKTGGYSIAVPELCLTDNAIIIRTELQGPESSEQAGTEASYPYVVVKTELIEQPVVFQ